MTHEDLEALMSERPDGVEQQPDESENLEGFRVVTAGNISGYDAGMSAHRGTLHPDEYVDPFVLREAAEQQLGFTYADVSAAYKAGRPTAEQRELRDRIDARLLALSREKASLITLAHVLNLDEKTLDRALARAKAADVPVIVKNPAVVHARQCFIEGTMDAKPRKRRFSKSPAHLVGTINLSDLAYRRGLDPRPGNPAYWAFMGKLRGPVAT